ncbi:hypothetical protein K1720_00525 [Thermococcus argininiproducens]|uniref:Uncharacterized protein n=1 Tax=Thermococcus argininiproducens TaxID=2866384 RepID=A0A9E7MCC5_9EURY|nr:hypothetical protein K1720_00525 [Thermococcus argininiproducens]
MATKVKNSEGVRLLINEVAKAVGVSPKELIEYYEWKANLKKIKTKKISKKDALEFLKSQEGKRKISEGEAVRIYYEAEEEIKRWREIERKLKKLGLE